MSVFLDDFAEFAATLPFRIIRISEMTGEDSIETYEQTEANPCQNTYSVAKSFTMTAIGLLSDIGELSMNDKVCDILADELPGEDMDERWKDVTVDMLLRHRAGLPGGFLDIDTTKASVFGRDYLRYALTWPLQYDPDTESRYSDGAYYILSRIAEKISGEKTDDFLWDRLLYKMDFQEMAWSHCPMGHPMGATGLYITSRDMVKLGWLYLNRGIYNGESLLSEEWIDTVLEREYAFDWDDTRTIFFKGGMCGQKLIVAPARRRAVALQSYGANSDTVAEWVRNYKDH